MFRFFVGIILLATLLLFPWWVSFIIAFVGSFLYKNFFEIVLLGALTDVFFGLESGGVFGIPFLYTFVYTIVFLIGLIAQQHIRPKNILS